MSSANPTLSTIIHAISLTFRNYLFLDDFQFARVLHAGASRGSIQDDAANAARDVFQATIRVHNPANVLDAARGQSLVVTVGNAKVAKNIGTQSRRDRTVTADQHPE